MIRDQLILDVHGELIIDNFAGGGGASTSIEMALGRHVDHAINHDKLALGMHRINHPQTIHHTEDIFEVEPAVICKGRPIGLGHFSPDCKHFSKAKGGQPLDKHIRGLVLIILKYAKYGMRVFTMENVMEIKTWGPLIRERRKGKMGWWPDKKHIGRTWLAFLDILGLGIDPAHPDLDFIIDVLGGAITREDCIRGFGYDIGMRDLRACDYGSRTIRKRLFLVGRNDGQPIVFPNPSHFQTPTRRQKPWGTIAECIDWRLPCPSIFLRGKKAKAAKCRRPLKPPTERRIAKGIGKFSIDAARPFLVNLTHQGGDRIESIDEPVRTVTGANRGEKALVSTMIARTDMPQSNAGCVYSPEEPVRTITSSGGFGMVEAKLAPHITEHANATHQRSFPADDPLRTQCAQVKGGHFAVVSGTLVQTGYGEREGQSPRALDIGKPLGTIVAGGAKHALVASNLVKLRGTNIGSGAAEPIHTISAGGTHHGVVSASLIRHFGESIGQDVAVPAPTIMPGGGGKTGVVVAHLAQHNGGFNETPGHPVTDPISTISATGSQQQLVTGTLAAYYGTAKDGQGVDTPARTVTAKARLGFVRSELANQLTPEQLAGARRVAKFLRKHGVEFEGEFATVGGYVIVDIGMRMLTPRELFRAQGFPDSYVIDRAWVVDPETGELVEITLTKEQQIRMCGNSVCPQVMAALIRANVPELRVRYGDERKEMVAA